MTDKRGASKVFFENPSRSIEYSGRPCVLELAISADLPLNHSCGGMGTCGTCRIIVKSDLTQLRERNEIEKEMASDRQFTSCERLACQLEAVDGLIAEIPD